MFKSSHSLNKSITSLDNLIDQLGNLSILSLESEKEINQFNKVKIKKSKIMSDNEDNNNDMDNMCAQRNYDPLKHLRIPDAIKDLPKYNGSKHELYEFIQNVEEILVLCEEVNGQPCSTILLRAIRNKIVGDANDILTMYGTELDWDQIKQNLITHYADKRDETNLIRDLHRISQGSDTIEKYFSKVIDMQNTMMNHTRLNTNAPLFEKNTIIKTKRVMFEQMCLNVFLSGLREPMGSMIRAMQPPDLPNAFSYCIKEQNISYMKKGSTLEFHRIPIIPPRLPFRPNPQFQPRMQVSNFNKFQGNQPYQYYNHRPFTNQNNNNWRSNNYNNNFQNKTPFQQNDFKPPIPPRKFEPMDTTSNQNKYTQPTYGNKNMNFQRPQNYSFRQNGPPRVHTQEIYQVDQKEEYEDDPCTQNYQDSYNPDIEEQTQELNDINYYPTLDHEIQDEDFRQNASITESDT